MSGLMRDQLSGPTGEYFIVEGVLKWYNTERGYGFLVPKDGGNDVMVHRSLIEDAGYSILNPGAVMRCEAELTDKGAIAVRIISVVDRALQMSNDLLNRMQQNDMPMVPAVTKWYHANKGYGFAMSSECDGDILITRQVLHSCGIAHLAPGQRVSVVLADTDKGKTASFVRLLPTTPTTR